MLQAKGIIKNYGNISILRGIDLEVAKGTLACIIGSSGAGKSTLLHILSTLDVADEGNVFINNTAIKSLSSNKLAAFRNKNIGFVFQFHHLLPEFTALENVSIPGWVAKRNKTEVKNEATKLLARLGLANKTSNKPNQLSGGEQQRVAVARALINNPLIVFADEPTGNLDSANATELNKLFAELSSENERTFLIATHNEGLAAISNTIFQIKDGILC
jgi:lipoprotein-releasing system ATP-binding protein